MSSRPTDFSTSASFSYHNAKLQPVVYNKLLIPNIKQSTSSITQPINQRPAFIHIHAQKLLANDKRVSNYQLGTPCDSFAQIQYATHCSTSSAGTVGKAAANAATVLGAGRAASVTASADGAPRRRCATRSAPSTAQHSSPTAAATNSCLFFCSQTQVNSYWAHPASRRNKPVSLPWINEFGIEFGIHDSQKIKATQIKVRRFWRWQVFSSNLYNQSRVSHSHHTWTISQGSSDTPVCRPLYSNPNDAVPYPIPCYRNPHSTVPYRTGRLSTHLHPQADAGLLSTVTQWSHDIR